eukprot:jgi/Tetstr1/461826/TSEL_006905.t1
MGGKSKFVEKYSQALLTGDYDSKRGDFHASAAVATYCGKLFKGVFFGHEGSPHMKGDGEYTYTRKQLELLEKWWKFPLSEAAYGWKKQDDLCRAFLHELATAKPGVAARLRAILARVNNDLPAELGPEDFGSQPMEWEVVDPNPITDTTLTKLTKEDSRLFFEAAYGDAVGLYSDLFPRIDPRVNPVVQFLFQIQVNSQYEFAIPVGQAADCLRGLVELVYDDTPGDIDGENIDDIHNDLLVERGFRIANPVRIIGQEDALLSVSNRSPVVWIDLTDYIMPNAVSQPGDTVPECANTNLRFFEYVTYLRSDPKCAGVRLHWGKAGFPERGCFNGAAEYPDTWCDFGCAIQRLDPDGKFEDNTQWWNFRGVDLERCCTASGFQSSWFGCTCNPEPLPGFQDCPAPNPPGYEPPLNDFDYDCTA